MAKEQKLDLLLRGGHVIDPINQVDGIRDVGIQQGRIAQVAEAIDPIAARQVLDLNGLYVTPGLIDIHIHAYWTRYLAGGKWGGSLNPDAHFLKQGVTTCVDTGTAGWQEIAHFKETVIDRAKMRVLAYINIAGPGMGDPEQVLTNLDPKAAAAAAEAFAQVVVGIKTAHYWTAQPFDNQHPPWASVEAAVVAGQLCNMPVMVDFWPRPPERSYDDLILKFLRPGDIHTHVFARQFPILDQNGKVNDFMFKARERGVHFDLGHGAASFWFRNGVPALEQGFPPDSISTDLHMGNINGHVHSMLDTMAKCMAMGMSLQEVVYRSTLTPAGAIGRPELGTLSVGALADIAVLERRQGAFTFRDCGWGRIEGKDKLACWLTLNKGEIVWDRHGLSCPDWRQADKGYWEMDQRPKPVPRMWRQG